MTAEDERWMRSALALAGRALGQTWPNPSVGALIVREGRLLGRGTTAPGGRPHAEVRALEMARALAGTEALHGATAYVTLEPCAHHGRTPPCADALRDAGIRRVVCPISDPDPRVNGAGFAQLRSAGVSVETGLMAAEARQLNAGFLSRIERRRPMVTLKLATTLDGRIGTASGESRWITGPAARRAVHMLRATHDAVLIGTGTARSDDPMLDVRDLGLAARSPVRVVADASLSVPLTGRLVASARVSPLWVLCRQEADESRRAALEAAGARTLTVPPTDNGMLDMAAGLRTLGDAGLTRVLCEGGARLATTLIRSRLVDHLIQFVAGKVIGGDGVPGVERLGLTKLIEAAPFRLTGCRHIGGDTRIDWMTVDTP